MNVLIFLPPAGRGIDTMAKVVLWEKLLRGGRDNRKDTDLSVLVSRDIGPFKFSLATTGAATNRFEHDCSPRPVSLFPFLVFLHFLPAFLNATLFSTYAC